MDSIDNIQKKIDSGKARVYTASELKALVKEGRGQDADVVTCGTFGIMSGTLAVLSFQVCGPDVFRKAETVTLNGVPCTPGPCPNESLGLIDCVVYGTSHRDSRYGGGHLFRDIVAGEPIEARVTSEGKEYVSTVTMDDMPTARIFLTRGGFKNYTCFVSEGPETRKTIFSGLPGFRGNLSMATVSGCGEINPVQNDPSLRYLRTGAPIMINGARGMLIGTGTRSTPQKPTLSAFADMHDMDPLLMGGFVTSAGPECITSIGAAIPVVDEQALKDLSVTDEETPMPLADVCNRIPQEWGTYASVWKGTHMLEITELDDCSKCARCNADEKCPVEARPSTRCPENDRCVRCGLCAETCVGKRFAADLGHINFKNRQVPITLRQSDRKRGEMICEDLKKRVAEGGWNLRV